MHIFLKYVAFKRLKFAKKRWIWNIAENYNLIFDTVSNDRETAYQCIKVFNPL